MNSFSWFLYAADVSNTLKGAFIPIIAFSMIAAVICTICGIFLHCEQYSYTKPEDIAWWEEKRVSCARLAKLLWPVSVIVLLVLCLIPSRSTFYAIAASQVGERVAQNEAVQGIATDATKALQIWIRNQIDPPAKSEK